MTNDVYNVWYVEEPSFHGKPIPALMYGSRPTGKTASGRKTRYSVIEKVPDNLVEASLDEIQSHFRKPRMSVLALDVNGTLFACDEYDPETGRVHILNFHRYGVYDKEESTIEMDKTVFDVSYTIYFEDAWPADMPTPTGYETVLRYFDR